MTEARRAVPPGTPGAEEATEGPTRRILLVDCDMFFVQVARLEDPAGVGKIPLLVVGGTPDGRGVITSASYEVRGYGVHSGMPTARALRLCPEATVVPVPREACSLRSRAVRDALERLSPIVEPASIDEFYLDLTGTERMFGSETFEETAHRIRERVLAETEISVSLGGGTRKMIAKLAAGRAKPAGVRIVPPGDESDFVRDFDLEDLPGVGPVFLSALREKELRRVEDVLAVEEEWLVRWFGRTRARWLRDRARGLDPTLVQSGTARKSVSSERTFRRDLDDRTELETILLEQVLTVGRTLRQRGLRARTVTVKSRSPDFRTRTASRTLPEAIESDSVLYTVARQLLKELLGRGTPRLRLLGVSASSLADDGAGGQLPLFDHPLVETERDRTLSQLMDVVRERFGGDALLPGRVVESTRHPKDADGEM